MTGTLFPVLKPCPICGHQVEVSEYGAGSPYSGRRQDRSAKIRCECGLSFYREWTVDLSTGKTLFGGLDIFEAWNAGRRMKTHESAADNNDGRKTTEAGKDTNVLRKTPEEIKADAATCLTKPPHSMCDRFNLNKKCKGDCGYVIKELYDLVLHYESLLAQVERERDAAVNELPHHCWNCAYHRNDPIEEIDTGGRTIHRYCDADFCYPDEENSSWQWRGPCSENEKEDTQDESASELQQNCGRNQ